MKKLKLINNENINKENINKENSNIAEFIK